MTYEGNAREIATQEGKVSVFSKANFTNPELRTCVQKLGFNPQLFSDLITLSHNHWVGDPETFSYPPEHPVEDITVRIAKTEDNKSVEVTEVTAYEAENMKTRLIAKPDQSIGFEAIYVREGSITFDILSGFEPGMGFYMDANKGRTSVTLEPGDLLIIPRPVARQVAEVKYGTKYVYFGDPWSDKDIPQDIL